MSDEAAPAPPPTTVTVTPPVVAVQQKQERSIRWTVFTIMGTGPTLIVLLWWVLKRLTAPQWCAVQVNAAKAVGAPPSATAPDCTNIILELLKIHHDAVIGLLIAIVVGYLVMVAMVLGAGVKVLGPGGINLEVGHDKDGDQ